MKILFFSPYFYPYISGLTTYPLKLLTHLSHEHQITVLTFPHSPSLPSEEEFKSLKIIRLPYNFKITKGYISHQSLSHFRAQLKLHDLVILNLPNAEGLPLAYLAHHSRLPIISIYHCQVNSNPGFASKMITATLNWSVNYQLAQSTWITAYTQDYVDHHPQINKYQTKVIIIPPPVAQLPVDLLYLTQLTQTKANQFWVGFSGRTAREKGLEHLIAALRELAQSHPLKLIFAGPYGDAVAGEQAYYQKIMHQLKASNLNYKFLGSLEKGKLGAFYQAIDVLCLPSVNSTEAFGMVQVEAMLLGAPVVTTNLPGVRVPVTETGMGLICEPGSSVDLRVALTKIIDNPANYSNPTKVKQAQSLFSEVNTYKLYDQLIHHLSI